MWQASLAAASADVREFSKLLSSAEQLRAAKFTFDIDRDRFVVGRGRLRQLLGGYLNADPRAVPLVDGEHGKPAIAEQASGLSFNLSHSRDVVVVAVSRDREVGVDVEWVHDDLDIDGLARRYFTAAEQQLLARTPATRRAYVFTTLWTRKEAVLKSFGVGLTISPKHVEVLPGRPARVSADTPERKWSLGRFATRQGYVAAVAVTPPVQRLPRTAAAPEG